MPSVKLNLRKYFIVFVSFYLFVFCHQKIQKHETQIDSSSTIEEVSLSTSGIISCESIPTVNQKKLLDSLLRDIKNTVSNMEYCPSIPYKPAPCPPRDIGPECKIIFEDLDDYLKVNFNRISFCVVNTSEWYAAVNVKESQPRIYVSTRFFSIEDYEEQKRSLVHELNHLQGNYAPHTGSKKECRYFQNDALKSEHCMTCGVSFIRIEQLTCSTGDDGIFTIKK
jgi:hypothetical protein